MVETFTLLSSILQVNDLNLDQNTDYTEVIRGLFQSF
jgi:hypothetical protein